MRQLQRTGATTLRPSLCFRQSIMPMSSSIKPGSGNENGSESARRKIMGRDAVYVGWLWDLLPFRKRETLAEHRENLSMDGRKTVSVLKDLREFEKHDSGKYFEAGQDLTAKSDSLPTPNIDGVLLTSGQSTTLQKLLKGKPTLLLFQFRQSGEEHLKTFREPFMEAFRQDPHVQCVTVIVTERKVYKLLEGLMRRGLRRQLPNELHSTCLLHYGNAIDLRKHLAMRNSLVGWAYLVDRRGLVRWQAHGKATEQEQKAMVSLLQELKNQYEVSTRAKSLLKENVAADEPLKKSTAVQ